MQRHWQYLKYVLRHKWFVWRAGRELFALRVYGVWTIPFWRLVLHDWDKFLPSMWFPYARTFYKPNGENQYQPTVQFKRAWNAHQKRNKHHWQYWILVEDEDGTECLEMPLTHVLEMLADWMGAGRAQGNSDTQSWYEQNYDNIRLHPMTRVFIDEWFVLNED